MPESLAKKPWWRRWFGNRSDVPPSRFLLGRGCRLLARNYQCQLGELDLVVLDDNVIVFVEVRSTGGNDAERPAASVDAAKQRRLTDLALHFLQAKRLLGLPARFDVLAISWPANQREPNIVHYRDAFEAIGRFQMFN